MLWKILTIFGLKTADLIETLYMLKTYGGREVNPLARKILEQPHGGALLLGTGYASIGGVLLFIEYLKPSLTSQEYDFLYNLIIGVCSIPVLWNLSEFIRAKHLSWKAVKEVKELREKLITSPHRKKYSKLFK